MGGVRRTKSSAAAVDPSTLRRALAATAESPTSSGADRRSTATAWLANDCRIARALRPICGNPGCREPLASRPTRSHHSRHRSTHERPCDTRVADRPPPGACCVPPAPSGNPPRQAPGAWLGSRSVSAGSRPRHWSEETSPSRGRSERECKTERWRRLAGRASPGEPDRRSSASEQRDDRGSTSNRRASGPA